MTTTQLNEDGVAKNLGWTMLMIVVSALVVAFALNGVQVGSNAVTPSGADFGSHR